MILLLSATCLASAEDTYPFSSPYAAQRFQTLTQEIRCVVCQNQNIADSNAPLASDLRTKIYRMVVNKKSDAEIKDYLVKRYGEFILLEPTFSKLSWLLWMFPLIGFGVFVTLYFMFKRKLN